LRRLYNCLLLSRIPISIEIMAAIHISLRRLQEENVQLDNNDDNENRRDKDN